MMQSRCMTSAKHSHVVAAGEPWTSFVASDPVDREPPLGQCRAILPASVGRDDRAVEKSKWVPVARGGQGAHPKIAESVSLLDRKYSVNHSALGADPT